MCPKCTSKNVATERRPNGNHICNDCHFSWPAAPSVKAEPAKDALSQLVALAPDERTKKKIQQWIKDWIYTNETEDVISPLAMIGTANVLDHVKQSIVHKMANGLVDNKFISIESKQFPSGHIHFKGRFLTFKNGGEA